MSDNNSSNRRSFLKKASSAAVIASSTAGLTSCISESTKTVNINFNNTYKWKMTTTWPPNFPVVGEGCKMMAEWVKEMSGGRMEITVYGAGELIPALEGFDAVSSGAIEMNHGAAYYWAGKLICAPFFTAVPFGMNAQQMGSWIISGGGQQLWEEVYKPYDLLPIICGNTGVQMGGWFNKEVNSLDDLKGLKMRIPGLGGKVFAKAGGTPLLVSGGEIYTNLERGVIDATEWIGPYHDYKMGFHQVAKYYYYPGWHEPGPVLELICNKSKFNELPSDLQEIVRTAAYRLNRWMMAEFDYKNGEYLQKIINETDVELKAFPAEVMHGLQQATKDTIDELVEKDEQTRKVYEHYSNFRNNIKSWMNISEKIFYNEIG
ncbi:TRAP transporter substrate-binding protein [Marinoscillum pacificum]|uniref:TRAP transporter substrate-binding protein n=1 Tax=Marinoscillum pacificum TaxID=392723 RepID=UPI0021570D93|nr:TRAP transporter substrate-binding protein [Marinoscillum pacificum]